VHRRQEGAGGVDAGTAGRAGHRCQRDDRQPAAGALLVAGPAGVGLDGAGEDGVALRAREDGRVGVVGEQAVLDVNARLGDEVVEPGRVPRRAAGRPDDDEALAAVGQVADGDGVRRAGAGAGGGEQEQPGSRERPADAAAVRAELVDDLLGVVGDLSLQKVDSTLTVSSG
jgi:hypothetical protein